MMSENVSDYYRTNVQLPMQEYDAKHPYKTFNYSWNDALRSSGDKQDIGFVQPPETTPIRLVQFDDNNYLDESSAKYNVTMHLSDLLLKQHMKFMDGSGNGYKSEFGVQSSTVTDGFFDHDPTYFIGKTNESGVNMKTVEQSSAEFFFYFRPTETAQYQIKPNESLQNLISYMAWVGDEALVNYTVQNAAVNTRGNVSETLTLHAGTFYPVRIHIGILNVPSFMKKQISIFELYHLYKNGVQLDSDQTIRTMMESVKVVHDAAGQPYEPLQLYYALVTPPTSAPVGVYQCLVTPTDVNNNYANNEALRQCRKGGKYIMGRISLATVNNGANRSLALMFRADGNLVLVDAQAGQAGQTAPPPTLFSLTNLKKLANCTAAGVDFDAAPDVLVRGQSIGLMLKSTKSTATDPNTGVAYSQYAYSAYTPSGDNVPTTDPGTTYTMNYSLGGEPKSIQASFDSPNSIKVTNLDKAIQCNPSFIFNNDGNLLIQQPNATGSGAMITLWSMFDDPQYAGIAGQIRTDASASVVNHDWYQQHYASYSKQPPKALHTMKTGEFVSSEGVSARPYLISANGKYRLIIEGNRLVFQYCLQPDTSKKTTNLSMTPNRYYLHGTDMKDMRLGKTFVVDTSGHSMKYVPPEGAEGTDAKNGILNWTAEFTQYNDAYPPNVITGDTRYQHFAGVKGPACQKLCTDSASKCTHYYSYTDDADQSHCTIGIGGTGLRYYPQNSVGGGVKTSSVYVRGQSIQTQCDPDQRKPTLIQVDAVVDAATDPLPWKIDTAPYTPALDREGPCGDDQIYNAYHQFASKPSKSKPSKESFGGRDIRNNNRSDTRSDKKSHQKPVKHQSGRGWREAFTSSVASSACTAGPTYNKDQCRTDMSNEFTRVLSSPAAATYAQQRFTEVGANYIDISNQLIRHAALLSATSPGADAIDNSGNLMVGENAKGYRRSMKYAYSKDAKDKLLFENQMYIVGTIVSASLLIGLFLIPGNA